MLVSFISSAFTGRMEELTQAIFSGGAAAVTLCISLLGTICLWSGLMRVADQAGLIRLVSRVLQPFIRLVFRGLDPDSPAAGAICMNISANVLGLGNAATPFGLQAMRHLSEENQNAPVASDHMITFVVLNTASVQILPTTIGMLRSKYGAANPMDIMPAIWITSILTLIAGLSMNAALCKLRRRRL